MHSSIKHITVRDIMKADFAMIEGMATIYDALMLIKKHRTSVLVVNKRHADDEFGILLVSDIARKVLAKDRSSKRVNVYEVMTKPAVYINPEMNIRYCSRLFAQFNLVRALVVENDEVIGTVSPNLLVLDGLFAMDED